MSKQENVNVIIRDANIRNIRVEVNKNAAIVAGLKEYHFFMCDQKSPFLKLSGQKIPPFEVPVYAAIYGTTDSGEEVRIGVVSGFILDNSIFHRYTDATQGQMYDTIDTATYSVWKGVLSKVPRTGHTLYWVNPMTLFIGTDNPRRQAELASRAFQSVVKEAEKATGIHIPLVAGELDMFVVIPREAIIGSVTNDENWMRDDTWHWLSVDRIFNEDFEFALHRTYGYLFGYIESERLSACEPMQDFSMYDEEFYD